MKPIILTLLLTVCLWAQKTPPEFFKQYDLKAMHDTSSRFVVLTNSSNVSDNVLTDVAYALNIYNKYVTIFPESKLNGMLIWYGLIPVVFDKFWLDVYNQATSSTKMNLIFIKISTELGIWLPMQLQQSRHYQQVKH
jgi:hypothetical protein